MGKFRKRPVEIEAVQLRWDTWDEMCKFADVGRLADGKPEGTYQNGDSNKICLAIPTLEGVMTAVENDWVIRGIKGELYPCKPDIFAATYAIVEPLVVSDEDRARQDAAIAKHVAGIEKLADAVKLLRKMMMALRLEAPKEVMDTVDAQLALVLKLAGVGG